MKKIKKRSATISLKKDHWNGKRLLSAGTEFKDPDCYEGKYHVDTAGVVFDDEKPEEPEKPEGSDELKEILK